MEKINGETLRDAVARLDRGDGPDWRKVVPLLAAGGRGLAAAHAAGFVHRDFKPENVLVDSDGRVFVGDFGIVSEADVPEAPSLRAGGTSTAKPLTRADEVIGTPAYMAPEQRRGRADARSDQFAFCVALYEALYGERPFAGESFRDYVGGVLRGAVRSPRSGRNVPAWLRAVLLRGLATDADDRFGSMDELLVELGADFAGSRHPGRRERMFVIVVLAGCFVIWSAVVSGLKIELTYALHYGTDAAVIALVLVLGRRLAQTPFNRKVYGIGLAAGVSVLVLSIGGALLGLSPLCVGVLHLFVGAVCSLAAAALLDRRLAVIAGCYFTAFFVAAAWPALFFLVALFAHAVLLIGLTVVLRAPGAVAAGGGHKGGGT